MIIDGGCSERLSLVPTHDSGDKRGADGKTASEFPRYVVKTE